MLGGGGGVVVVLVVISAAAGQDRVLRRRGYGRRVGEDVARASAGAWNIIKEGFHLHDKHIYNMTPTV